MAEEVRRKLRYDPETGKLYWNWFQDSMSRWNTLYADKVAGHVGKTGYVWINFPKPVPAHRLAWVIMTGEWPSMQVDHVNCNKADNRWSNLRLATHSQNMANTKKRKHNTSGLRGVVVEKRTKNRWVAQICASGKTRRIGTFDCPAAASFAYQVEADKAFGSFTRV